ncbi:MAG: hypothetical protein IJO33_02225 [Bacilli bacterium]|nr:hypothetical protein [Bacilli bacterium]
MNKKLIVFILISIFVFPMVVFADEGPKPSIDIKIKNLNTTNYLVDLFVYDEDGTAYASEMNYNGEGLSKKQINKLYELNFDGWISEATRWNHYLLFAQCAGNSKYENSFSYFGTPKKYKIVIINNDTGDIKISNEIIRNDFNSYVIIDYDTMNVVNENNNYLKTIMNLIIALILTVGFELLIAYILKIKNYKIITVTNVITNLVLQILLVIFTNNYLLSFIVGELIIILTELIVYLCNLKNITKFKIILYTLTANAITIVITFLLK